MTSNDRLIIFVRNPELGKVKAGLAREIGAEQALNVYHKLLVHSKEITKKLNCEKAVYYSDFLDHGDLWDNMLYEKNLQQGSDMGEKMQAAFAQGFADGKQRVIIIGCDCIELETSMIKEAFAVLENNDVVIGPSRNGTYYLLGMRKFLPTLFEDKNWDYQDVLMDTLLDLKKMKASYYLLKTLCAIEKQEDLHLMKHSVAQRPEDWF